MSPSQNSRIHRIARPLVVAVLLMGAMPRICRAWSSSAAARGLLAVAAVGLLRAACAAQTVYAKPGDTLSFPTPIVNATADGAPGGDTINSMQLVIVSTDGSGAVTNATPSATQSIAPGAAVTFTPSFVVGNVPDGTYSFTLHMVSSDAGIIPDPDSAAVLPQLKLDTLPLKLTDT